MPALLDEIYAKYKKGNRAYAVMLELTYRCVCRCVHCYIDDYESEEMGTSEIVDLLDQLKDEGVLDIGLTGGEVFLRDDLETILEETSRRGFVTYVLTTGILINEKRADMLKRNRIHHVEISLMGATAETHDLVMRHPGAFDKTMNAVRLLAERGIPVVLKNSVLRQNYRELPAMFKLAETLKLPFSANISVLPRIDGTFDNQHCALDYQTALSIDSSLMQGGLLPNEDARGGAKLTCNAGKTTCGISPTGIVYPCLIWRMPLGNVRENRFRDIWRDKPNESLRRLRAMKGEDAKECFSCDFAKKCKRCPGLAFSETGDYLSPVESSCILAGKKAIK